MRTICCVAVGILLVCAVGAAQDDDQGILLRYKYQPGQELRYGVSGTAEGLMRIDGIPDAPPPQDLWMEGSVTVDMETQSVDEEGVGQLRLTVHDAFAKMQVFGEVVECQLQDGRLIITQGGEVQLDTANPPADEGDDEAANPMFGAPGFRQLLDLVMENGLIVQLAPDGRLVGLPQLVLLPDELKNAIPGLDIDRLLEHSQASFPAHPVKVGGTWEVREPMLLPGGAEGDLPEAVTTYTLAAIEEIEGRQCARIVGTASMDLAGVGGLPTMMGPFGPPGAAGGLELRTAQFSVQQTDHFDYERGLTLRSTVDVKAELDIHQDMTVPTPNGEVNVSMDIGIQGFKLALDASLLE